MEGMKCIKNQTGSVEVIKSQMESVECIKSQMEGDAVRTPLLQSLLEFWTSGRVNLQHFCRENFNFSFKMKGMWAELADLMIW